MLADKRERLFKQWLGEHNGLVFKIVRTYAALPEDRDDLLQDILVQIWVSIPNFNNKAKETTWIYKVALNTALLWKRTKKRKKLQCQGLMIDISKTPDIQKDIYATKQEEQIIDRLHMAIRKLSKVEGSIVFMHLDGLSYLEMAEILGVSESYVGVKLNRAKKKLAKLLKGIIDEV